MMVDQVRSACDVRVHVKAETLISDSGYLPKNRYLRKSKIYHIPRLRITELPYYRIICRIVPWAYNPFVPLRIRWDLGLYESGGFYQGGDYATDNTVIGLMPCDQ
jgi:hypothetical protein